MEDNSEREENYCITEINARFSFNGFMHEAYGQAATNESIESAETELISATDPDTVRQYPCTFRLFVLTRVDTGGVIQLV